MKKSKALLYLFIFIFTLSLCAYTSFIGFGNTQSGSIYGIKLGLDLAGGVSITYQVVGDETPSSEDMADTIYKMQKRIENYSNEAIVYKEGSDRINIEIPGVSDANAILEELGKPGSLVFLNHNFEEVLRGTDVIHAVATYQPDHMGNNEAVVALTMSPLGAAKFAEATRIAAPTREVIYIVYDDEIVSFPAVQSEITSGEAVISGNFSFEEAEKLASTIRIGGLKLELEELRSNVVGAQLGEEAITSSLKAAAIGLAIMIAFMIAVYFLPGFAAGLALLLYTTLIIVLLEAFDITLTLPGIAGIILSIGMAIDANIIVFARIREEIAAGKTISSSIKSGYKKALSAIVDVNITTLIAAAVLYMLGTGPIRGFAATLALGIILSMFTALFVTKWLMNILYTLGFQSVKFYGTAKERKTINFVAKKAIFFVASSILIIVGFVFMYLNQSNIGAPFNLSLEYLGGTSTKVVFNEDFSLSEIDNNVVPLIEDITGDANVQTQKVAGTNDVIFKTRSLDNYEREAFNQSMTEHFAADPELITAETISSTISNEMQRDAILAVLFASLGITLYIWLRFKDIRFGASVTFALIHDVLVVLAFYAVSKVSVGSTFIACMLTIVGYSINASIVIFDRVRENMAEMKRKDSLDEIMNKSITQTLSRSVFTSLTTFVMVAVLYFLGVSSIKEFALPLMVGIICGTYSSICVAGAFWVILRKKFALKTDN
ncbi:MAG: protein translocase subunit SecD [Lachnospiraceae bacterium]|nr:protein translocase subunit SecD [Lachnospiraceae bacterium]